MADLFVPALIAGGAYLIAAYSWSLKQKLVAPPIPPPPEEPPTQGVFGHIKDYWSAPTRGQFKSVVETTDQLGARIFLVDYGNGSLVTQYHDPRILL